MTNMTQRQIRQAVFVDRGLRDVTSVTSWYRAGHFKSEEAATGAFELAYQQGMDGMGKSIESWMGMSDLEYDKWMRSKTLPPKNKL